MKYKSYGLIIGFLISMLLVSCSKEEVQDDGKKPERVPTPEGTVDISYKTVSLVLEREMHFSVYLPFGYDTSGLDYPVLYLLHGMWGNYEDWVNHGMAGVMDSYINEGYAKPMIVIMPDGLDAFYCNNYNNGTMRYEDYMTEELFPYVEETFRTKNTRENRAIAGLSMGGYGAVFHAFKRHEMFGSCYSMSGALDMGDSAPDLQEIINNKTEDELENLPAFTMECGTEDFLVYASNVTFDIFLNDKGIEHTFIVRTGTHDWAFWMECLPNVIIFISDYFTD